MKHSVEKYHQDLVQGFLTIRVHYGYFLEIFPIVNSSCTNSTKAPKMVSYTEWAGHVRQLEFPIVNRLDDKITLWCLEKDLRLSNTTNA